jgi:hypothetical protein
MNQGVIQSQKKGSYHMESMKEKGAGKERKSSRVIAKGYHMWERKGEESGIRERGRMEVGRGVRVTLRVMKGRCGSQRHCLRQRGRGSEREKVRGEGDQGGTRSWCVAGIV